MPIRGSIAGAVALQRTPRDPKLAFLLSFFLAGSGQLYNRQYLKGLLCLVAYAVTLFGSILLSSSSW
jgi:TM2 domain-containing membrane protein YozV